MTVDKYTLHKDGETEKWRVEKEGSDKARMAFRTTGQDGSSIQKLKRSGAFAKMSGQMVARCESGRWTIRFKKSGPILDQRTPKRRRADLYVSTSHLDNETML